MSTDYGASWQFSLDCRKCGRKYRPMLKGRIGGLTADEPCEGAGPTFEEWLHEGSSEADYEVIEVRARSAEQAIAMAVKQLRLPEEQVDIHIAGEGTPGGRKGNQVVVWARPKGR